MIRSQNDGMVWVHVAEAPLGAINAQVLAVDPSNENVIWAGGGGNPLWPAPRTQAHRGQRCLPKGPVQLLESLFTPVIPQRIWVADTQNVRRSIDGGTSFFPSRQGLPASANINALVRDQSTDTVFVGTTSGVYESRDDGATFTPFSTGIEAISILDLAIVESPRAMVVASVYWSSSARNGQARPGSW